MTVATETAWRAYSPRKDGPWDAPRAALLLRRAALGATPAEIDRAVAMGHVEAIARVLESRFERSSRPDALEFAARLESAAATTSSISRLQAAQIYRMAFSPDPLLEQLTLFFTDWFATSERKVRIIHWMAEQNATIRRLARGHFGALLHAMLRDKALLDWLDAQTNKKGRPNENLARELLELFSLGVGNYTEKDVAEVARSLTGWASGKEGMAEEPADHDDGEMTILGRTGSFRAPDVVEILIDHEATATRLARRLIAFFFGEGQVDDAAIAELAAQLRTTHLDVGMAVATILRSALFLDPQGAEERVVLPHEFILSTLRALDIEGSEIDTFECATRLARMGLELFRPPNVGGWNFGRAYLAPHLLASRIRFATDLIEGTITKSGTPLDVARLVRQRSEARAAGVAEALSLTLRGKGLTGDELSWLRSNGAGGPSQEPKDLRLTAALTLSAPWMQVA